MDGNLQWSWSWSRWFFPSEIIWRGHEFMKILEVWVCLLMASQSKPFTTHNQWEDIQRCEGKQGCKLLTSPASYHSCIITIEPYITALPGWILSLSNIAIRFLYVFCNLIAYLLLFENWFLFSYTHKYNKVIFVTMKCAVHMDLQSVSMTLFCEQHSMLNTPTPFPPAPWPWGTTLISPTEWSYPLQYPPTVTLILSVIPTFPPHVSRHIMYLNFLQLPYFT